MKKVGSVVQNKNMKKEDTKEEWKTIDIRRVVDKHFPAGFLTNGLTTYKTEYIIRNIKTGEVRRV